MAGAARRRAALGAAGVHAILKHVRYKEGRDCVLVTKTARVRLPDGRRVYATRAWWEYAFGMCARKADAHVRRTCEAAQGGGVCMNPAHIVVRATGEALAAALGRGKGKKGAPTEETLWAPRAGATEELVIAEEDIPRDMEDALPAWRVVDYFSLAPEVHLHGGARRAVTG